MKLKKLATVSSAALIIVSGTSLADPIEPVPPVFPKDVASATVLWKGRAGGVTPGSNITITGLNGGDIETGTLTVESDGTFTSGAVRVEARHNKFYNHSLVKADWMYLSSTVSFNSVPANEADVLVYDEHSGHPLERDTPLVSKDILDLTVSNKTKVESVEIKGQVDVSVTVQASPTV
ncbi:hypothetical protein [Vibrio sp. AND4]|uniref:hypothetical protein n=1 Tax=Vibrio sp. AND4 TaxID=314289 RepID=UPI0005C75477|nr:hypothetical protein [Vibrio sp. AND4]